MQKATPFRSKPKDAEEFTLSQTQCQPQERFAVARPDLLVTPPAGNIQVRDVHGKPGFLCLAMPFLEEIPTGRNSTRFRSKKVLCSGSRTFVQNLADQPNNFKCHSKQGAKAALSCCGTRISLIATLFGKPFNLHQKTCRVRNYPSSLKPEEIPSTSWHNGKHQCVDI